MNKGIVSQFPDILCENKHIAIGAIPSVRPSVHKEPYDCYNDQI